MRQCVHTPAREAAICEVNDGGNFPARRHRPESLEEGGPLNTYVTWSANPKGGLQLHFYYFVVFFTVFFSVFYCFLLFS